MSDLSKLRELAAHAGNDGAANIALLEELKPSTVLALLDRLEVAERERDEALEGVADQRLGIARKLEDIAALENEVLDLTARAEAAEAKIAATLALVTHLGSEYQHHHTLPVANLNGIAAALQESEGE